MAESVKWPDVPLVVQRGNNCWIACAAMVLSWKYKRLYSLSDIRVQYDPNLASFDWSVMYAELQKLNFQTQRPPKPAQEDIESILKEHGPFILLHLSGKIPYHSIYPLPPAGTTHAIVITGTDPHGFIRGDKNGADRLRKLPHYGSD